VIEHTDELYWFDAGEGCSYTAHLAGLDLLRIRAIFITHPHMDHVGGLANLIWTMQKLDGRSRDPEAGLAGKTIPVFIPNLSVWKGILGVLAGPSQSFDPGFTLKAQTYTDGDVYDQDGFSVQARHNTHLGIPQDGALWQSFSLRIETADGAITTSGDVGHIEELEDFVPDSDLFLMETGHHKVSEVCEFLHNRNVAFGRLGFFHHGRAILEDSDAELQKAEDILGKRVFIAEDGMTLEI
jgi:ribonuclease BN (tRNA processing enzyme)